MIKKIGYFGDESSHTYACAIERYRGNEMVGFATIASAVDAVSRGKIDGAVIPIENSVGGTVSETLDALKESSVYITALYSLKISHSLIAIAGTKKEDIRRIYSHHQALSQCQQYLLKEFPTASLYPVKSTSEALEMLSEQGEAAIARLPLPGQTVLQSGIEDSKTNETRFVFIEREPSYQDGKKVSIMFDTENRPGALLEMLTVLKDLDLNMSKLESRPAHDGFRYWFYVEFDCNENADGVQKILDKMASCGATIKFLGSYKQQ
ncbi:MAG: ACT domain-containing protein [Clostridia bacterium]|nr:ACT domain-containing protein [Clostridia bacterium]